MPLPQVHFAVGMGVGSLLGIPMLLRRRRWLVWLPLLMTACGGLALAPDALSLGRGDAHRPAANAFFLHYWLDHQPALYSTGAANLAFHAVALAYFAAACAYAAYIRWGLRRLPEAEEALARLHREAAGYRPAAALLGVLPLLLAGAAVVVALWPRRGPDARRPGEPKDPGAAQWAQLVSRRLGVSPGQRLGVVHATWDPAGAWLCGDLGASSSPRAPDLLARAKVNGCDFVALLDGAFSADELAAARRKHPDLAVISGLVWNASREKALALMPPLPNEAEVLAAFRKQFGSQAGPAEEALKWLGSHAASPRGLPVVLSCPRPDAAEGWEELFSWRRTNGLFAGFVGLEGSERLSAREARSQWNPRVATVGGVWDRFLDRGFRLWGAAAASGFADPARHFWPGEFARTYVWCRGRSTDDVLEGLRRGCFWAAEGGVVRALDFGVASSQLERPARMGEVARLAPDEEAVVELALDVPPADFAGRPNALDEVELISNFGGEPAVLARFRDVRDVRRLTHRLPPASDANGGVGFYVRARGWRRLAGGERLFFYTNPIHVLVRPGLAPPPSVMSAPVRVAGGTGFLPVAPPTGKMPVPPEVPTPPPVDELAAKLAALGLPASVRVAHIETFQKPPAQGWRGAHASIIGDRGPAMGDEELRVELLRRMPLTAGTRLFFFCYAVECSRLTVLARVGDKAAPYQVVRDLPERQWVALDLSFADDFLPMRGAPERIAAPTEVQAIEWTGGRLGPLSRFYVADVVVYEPTLASRQELAWRQAGELDTALREAAGRGAPPSARQRADAAMKRLAALGGQLDPKRGPLAEGELAAAERALGELAIEARGVRWQSATARTFGVADPAFALTLAAPYQRISARNPAFVPGAQLAGSWELAAAGGEAESLQVAIMALSQRLEGVNVRVTDFVPAGGRGAGLSAAAVSLALVGEVEVRPRPALPREQTGWVPDPLPPFQPFDVEPGQVRCVLLTVEVPPDLLPGDYEAEVSVEPKGLEPVRASVKLRRWGFALEGQPLPVLAPLDERAIAAGLGLGKGVPQEVRRALYELLLRYRVSPIPLLGGDEEADLAEALFCAEHGEELVVLREASSAAPRTRDPEVARAARLASRLMEAGWGRRGAFLLPLAPAGEQDRARMTAFARALAQERPGLLLLAGGEGEPPGDLVAHLWRRPLSGDPPRRPRDDEAEVRLSRTARREAWELVAGTPESSGPSLLLTCPLAHVRLLPWLAWQHGVRALFLRGVARWQEKDDLRDAVLLYPPAPGDGGGKVAAALPHPSLRLAALRDGAEDYAYLRLMWDRARLLRERAAERHAAALADAERLLAEAAVAIGTFQRPCRDPLVLAALRARVAREIERLEAAWWAEVDAAADLPPPPAEVAAKPGDGQVALTWARSPEPKVAAYSLFRSRDPKVGFARINPVPITGLSYVDRVVDNDATYHYFLRSCLDGTQEGPRSQVVAVRTRPAPRVVWLPAATLAANSVGPFRVALRLEGPGTEGLLPLVRPQIDYALGEAAYGGFKEMARQEDGSWVFDIPDPGWRRLAGKGLRIQVRIVDRPGRVVASPPERREAVGP